MGAWRTVDSMPERGEFLVYLADVDHVQGSRVGVAMIHRNLCIVNGRFRFDMPEITHWRDQPDPPEESGS